MELLEHTVKRHEKDITEIKKDVDALKCNDTKFDVTIQRLIVQMDNLEKAIGKKAEFWDKVKVSITTSVILFFIMWILNSTGIFGG